MSDVDGAEYDMTEQMKIFLCAWGNSEPKPFCDGRHETTSFNATPELCVQRTRRRGTNEPAAPARAAPTTQLL